MPIGSRSSASVRSRGGGGFFLGHLSLASGAGSGALTVGGCAVAAPGLYVWEASTEETAWARELAAFARALAQPRPR